MRFFRVLLASVGFKTRDERKRAIELIALITVSVLFVALSRLEGRLLDLSRELSRFKEFLDSFVYFGLINVNVLLILILSFLIFRNIVKLVVDRRHGVIGSKLRTKLVVALVFFAVAPTTLLFYISARFLTQSFETLFSSRVEITLHKTREAGAMVYDRDQRRIANLARLAVQKIEIESEIQGNNGELFEINPNKLRAFVRDARLSKLKVFSHDLDLLWASEGKDIIISLKERDFLEDALVKFDVFPTLSSRSAIDADGDRDVVRAVAPILSRDGKKKLGLILIEEQFDTQILQSVETIIEEFSNLKPGAKLIRLSYIILLILMVVIIAFSAIWLGFYVARAIIAPIQRLALATKEVAAGNYGFSLEIGADDETGQLIQAFNNMTKDLKAHEHQVQNFTAQLEEKNHELDQRRKYMEVVLKHISAGVISVDSGGIITSLNPAAEKLLGISIENGLGKNVNQILDIKLQMHFWDPIMERVRFTPFSGEVDLEEAGIHVTLLADATRIVDEDGNDLGVVVVFDDASDQVKAQRVAAWREVARRIAHEIKNPITPIKISAQRLLRRFGEQFQGKDHQIFVSCIETIISEVDSLRDLVNEFSKFSRLPSIKTKLEDINSLVRDVVNLFSMSYPNIEFDLSQLDDQIPQISIDREQMVRVFNNILTNAVAAIPEERTKGEIVCITRWLNDYQIVRIEIADNGVGIPDHLKQRVLEPYFSTKKEGTGLGLAIVHQIISDHGGYLRISDNTPIGVIIVIELPFDGVQMGKRLER